MTLLNPNNFRDVLNILTNSGLHLSYDEFDKIFKELSDQQRIDSLFNSFVFFGNRSDRIAQKVNYKRDENGINVLHFNGRLLNQRNRLYVSDIQSEIQPTVALPYLSDESKYYQVRFNRNYYNDEDLKFVNKKIISGHYTQPQASNSELLFSDDVGSMTHVDLTDLDFFYSDMLDNHDNQQFDSIDESSISHDLEIVTKKIDKVFDDTSLANGSSDSKESLKNQLNNTVQKGIIAMKGNSSSTEGDELFDFLTYIFANTLDHNIVGIIGQVRILETNPSESPFYDDLFEMYQNDETIKNLATKSFNRFNQFFDKDTRAIVDSIDLFNETKLVQSIINSNFSSIISSISTIGKKIENFDILSLTIDEVKQLTQQLNEIFNNNSSVLKDFVNNVKSLQDLKARNDDDDSKHYDSILLNRNINNATKYSSDFINSFISDPYLALTQHVEYTKKRLEKLTVSLKAINFVISITNGGGR